MAKKMAPPPKADQRVDSHVQERPAGAAVPPEQDGEAALPRAVVGDVEGMSERLDLLGAVGMEFGDLDRGVAPDDPSSWTPTSM